MNFYKYSYNLIFQSQSVDSIIELKKMYIPLKRSREGFYHTHLLVKIVGWKYLIFAVEWGGVGGERGNISHNTGRTDGTGWQWWWSRPPVSQPVRVCLPTCEDQPQDLQGRRGISRFSGWDWLPSPLSLSKIARVNFLNKICIFKLKKTTVK